MQISQSEGEVRFSDAQANEILRTAVRLAAPGEISFEELVAAAKELGITGEELIQAEEKYRQESSEAGQRAQFKVMQRHEVRRVAFLLAFMGVAFTLISWVDLPSLIRYAVPISWVVLGLAFFFIRRYHLSETPRHEITFQHWQQKKKVWLRPERSQEVVAEILREPIRLGERLEQGDPELLMRRRLQNRFGYDKVRAQTIVAAQIRDHPELLEHFRR